MARLERLQQEKEAQERQAADSHKAQKEEIRTLKKDAEQRKQRLADQKEKIRTLEKDVSWTVGGGRRGLGGPGALSPELLDRCQLPFKAWVGQSHNQVCAEFSDKEVWSAFQVFDLNRITSVVIGSMLSGDRALLQATCLEVQGVLPRLHGRVR